MTDTDQTTTPEVPEPETTETPRPRKSRLWRFVILGFAVVAIVVASVIAGSFAWINAWAFRAGPLSQETTVVIKSGQGLSSIAESLQAAGVIEHPQRLVLWARLNDMGRNLKAGEYSFSPGTSPRGALALLEEGDVVIYQQRIPEGLTNREVFDRLEADDRLSGEITAPPAEGWLLPETYNYQRDDDRQELVSRMEQAMRNTLDALWDSRVEGLPFNTKEEALALASIVEKETGLDAERAKVAAVFVNRLKRGMKLQSDPTVIYALTDGQQPLGRMLTRADWKFDHPYNTYRIAGLPPGPIANPGRASIEAVLNPDSHNYIFFVADGSGGHAFAVTYDEHKRNIARARAARNGN